MKNEIVFAAEKSIKNKIIYDWVLRFIKTGHSYSEPTSLFNTIPSNLSSNVIRYFEDPNNGLGILYSREGALALMNQVIKSYSDV
jgi:hypothetical protein